MTSAIPEHEARVGTPAGTPGLEMQEIAGRDPDLEWVRRAARGECTAFDELVRRHQSRVYTRISFMTRDRDLALDLTQEAFLKAWRNIAGFRAEATFSTWLGRIAVNVTLHHFERARARKRGGRTLSIERGHDPDGDERGIVVEDRTQDPVDWAIRDERQAAIVRAVEGLEEEYRLALTLREMHGFSYQEIADGLEIPIGTVKSRIFRARQMLQEKLQGLL